MHRKTIFRRTVIAASLLGLISCGGGSDTASAPTQISGTAAAGAPFSGATITLTDANGTQRTATAAIDGSFTLDAKGLTAPFVLNATGIIGDTTATFIAVASEGPKEGEIKTLNVTPLTTAVAALLSDHNDPMEMTDPAKLKAKATPAQINAIVAALRTLLAEVIKSTGVNAATFDPMTTAFKADRTGLDAVLDAIKVSLSDQGVVLTNAFDPIAASATDSNAAPTSSVSLTKAGLASPPTPFAAPAISISTIAAILDKWRDEINACFAQTAANRVTLDGNGFVVGVKGACANVRGFHPTYKSNGYTLFQRFGGLLSDPELDGAKFALPEVLTLLKTDAGEDRAVFRVFYKRSDGNTGHVLDVAQKMSSATATDNGWRVVGNQRDYDASVDARSDRIFHLKSGGKEEYRSGLRLYFNPLGPNASDVTMVRITGPGLPAAGVVLGKSNACGTSNYLSIQNKTGTLSVSDTNTAVAGRFLLGASFADNSPYTWPGSLANWGDAPLADFSGLRAFMRYKFEVYRTATDKKAEFYTRLTTAPIASGRVKALQWHTLTAASKEYLDPNHPSKAGAQTAATVEWQRNSFAAPVEGVSVFGVSASTRVQAQKLGVEPGDTATTVAADAFGTSFGESCASTQVPALNVAGSYRDITLRSRNSSDMRQYETWTYQN
jgi:hypothetical protein